MSIAEFAAAQGIELLPWQVSAAELIERGERPILVGGKKAGRKTFQRIVREWEAHQATAPDVRTAAQAEAEASIHVPVWFPTHDIRADLTPLARQHFVDGAVWGAALVTPTREQIARTLAMTDDYDGCFERIDEWEALEQWERDAQPQEAPSSELEDADFWMRRADAVLALFRPPSGV